MAKQVQFRGGSTANHATFTGAAREITVDTTLNSLVVHDGATPGGHPIAKAGANTDITSIALSQTGLQVKGASANKLTLKPNETLSAARILNLKVNDADRTIDLAANLTVSSAATVSGTNTGDQTITLSGDVSGSGTGAITTTIGANKVTLAMMAQMATASFLGRTTASTGNVEVLTATQATALLNAMVGDSGSGGTKGLAPAPSAGDAAAGKYLKADGTWAAPGGWTVSAGNSVTGTVIDIAIPSTANEAILIFNNVSIGTNNADLRIQGLTAASTTGGTVQAMGAYDLGAPAVVKLNSSNSFIGTTGTSQNSHTIDGYVHLFGMAANSAAGCAFTSAWFNDSGSAGSGKESGQANGYWASTTQLYGLRITRTSGSFDGSGTYTIMYR